MEILTSAKRKKKIEAKPPASWILSTWKDFDSGSPKFEDWRFSKLELDLNNLKNTWRLLQ